MTKSFSCTRKGPGIRHKQGDGKKVNKRIHRVGKRGKSYYKVLPPTRPVTGDHLKGKSK